MFSKTVNSIIADILKKIEQLHVVAEFKAAEAEAHDAVVAERTKLAVFARSEYDRAKKIASNLTNLLS